MTKNSNRMPFRLFKFIGPSKDLTWSDENYGKLVLIHSFSMLGMFATGLFGIWRLKNGDLPMAYLDFGYGLFLGLAYFLARKAGMVSLVCWFGVIQFMIFILILLLMEVDGGSGYVWMFLFPSVTIYLLGHRHGSIMVAVFLVLIAGLMFTPNLIRTTTFNSSFPYKLILAMITVSIVSFAFEFARQRVNKEIRRARVDAEEASRLKSEFLANISHEVRTPMNGIMGLLDILSRTDLDDEQSEYLSLLKDTASQSLTILNELLDLSKAEAGKLDLEPVPTDVLQIAREIADAYRPKAESKGLVLEFHAPDSLPTVQLDPMRLRQVLHNFLNNALKFTEHGSIKFVIEAIEETAGDSLEIKFSVRDTGIGVPPEQVSSIFEAFVQADGSFTRQQGGTGLGLAISKKIVQMMGGHIGYLPTADGGSNFWFTAKLPIAHETKVTSKTTSPSEQAAPSEKRTQASHLTGKVLLVEDNPVNRLVAQAMLKRLGLDVVQAEDGIQALEIFSEHDVDAILMDVQMPKMDGFQATAQIRKIEGDGQRVPIIALTAHAMPEDREQCLKNNMDDYLSKPFSEDALLDVLKRHIHQQSAA